MARSSTSLVAFLVGAALGGRLAVAMAATSRRRWLLTVALSEALLLVAAAIASIGFDIGSAPPSRLYTVIVLTALAMGLRNATVRRLAVPDLTTTVLTQTLTDVAADSSVAGGDNPRTGRRFGRLDIRRGGGRDPAFTARAGSPAHRGCGRRARRHGRLRRRPDATTGAGLGTTRRGWPKPHQSRVAATARSA